MVSEITQFCRYRLWLEVYLTNGRTKKSNVKDFVTKLGPTSTPSTSQGKSFPKAGFTLATKMLANKRQL